MTVEQKNRGTICWFDVPCDDIERAQAFYGEIFGWKFQKMEAAIPYFAIIVDEEASKQVEGPPAIGALCARQMPGLPITSYFSVANCAECTAKIEELGGEVLLANQPVPGFGYMSHCTDLEGNVFAVWEENPEAQ